jgi:hypothetical protein
MFALRYWFGKSIEQLLARVRTNPSLELCFVFLLFVAATTIFFWRWVPHLNLALLGPPEDNMLEFWSTWYTTVAANSDFFFTNLIRYPEGIPLYYHPFTYPKVFVIALLCKIIGADWTTLLLLHNLSLLISFPLAATGAFYLVRYYIPDNVAALVGGFVFAFNPSHVMHVMHHLHVSSIEFIPFFVLFYLLALDKRSVPLLLVAIVLFALNALSCWYYLFYVAYFIAFHTIYGAVRDRALPSGWQLFVPVACVVGVTVLLSPILIPMVGAALGGAAVYAPGGGTYVADVLAYPAFPPFHALAPLSHGIYSRLAGNEWEATVYLGWINMGVLAWLCFATPYRNNRLMIYLLCGMALFCIFATGYRLRVLGYPIIPMPTAVLSQLPFFKNVRTPSRAIVFVYMFLAIGIGHAIVLAREHWRGTTARWGVAGVVFLMVLDFFPVRALATTPVFCSPGLAIIRDDHERGFGVLDLPTRGYGEETFYMAQQAVCHGRPILHGMSGRDIVKSLRDRLDTTDFQVQRRQLTEAKVKYIVLRKQSEAIPLRFVWPPEDGLRDQYLRTYPVVYDETYLTVLRVY